MVDSPQSPQKSQQCHNQQGASTITSIKHDTPFWLYTLLEGILIYLFKGLFLSFFFLSMVAILNNPLSSAPLNFTFPMNESELGIAFGLAVGLAVGWGLLALYLDFAADGLASLPASLAGYPQWDIWVSGSQDFLRSIKLTFKCPHNSAQDKQNYDRHAQV